MRLLPRPLGGPPLVRDYLAGKDSAARFYRGSPFRLESYRRRAEELEDSVGGAATARLAPMVRPAGPAGRRALDEVAARRGFFVTTGQQPGLFGGPLYTLYKALTAVRLAETLARGLGRPVMPLFWIASEDHDWREAARAFVIDSSNTFRALFLQPPADAPPRALSRIPLGADVERVVDQLADHFPRNDFHARYIGLVREAYAPSATLAAAFANLMAELLRDTPLGFVDAADPALKRASLPILEAEAEDAPLSEAAVEDACTRLRRARYDLQVPFIPGAVNLLVDTEETGRDRLHRSGSGFRLRRSGGRLSRADLRGLLADDPGLVSPNVLLRPVVESFVFPTLAYVGGPAELAYFAQLSGLFRRHGVGMPVAAPRASLLAVEAKVDRVLEKHRLGVDDLARAGEIATRLALDRMPEDVARPLADWRAAVEARAAELGRGAAAVDPALRGAVLKARNAGLSALQAMEKKIARSLKRRHEVALAQIGKARANLWPGGGRPQERALAHLQYAMRYGGGFAEAALQEIRVEPAP